MLPAVAATAVLAGAVAACADSSQSGPAHAPGPTSTPATTPTRPPFQVRTFTAFTAAGVPSVPITVRTSGSCFTASVSVDDATAYRCIAGNDLLDPCFAPPHQSHPAAVACIPDPWSGARLVTLTAPLPTQPRPPRSQHRYWALELSDGKHCVAVSGTVPTVAGVPLDYLCGTGTAAGALRTKDGGLVVDFGELSGSRLTTLAVTTAWDG